MIKIPDEAITEAIQYFGMAHVQRIQQELVEGMRNGEPRGYVALRGLLGQLEEISQLTDKQVELATDWNVIEDLQDPEITPMLSPARYISLLGIDVETLSRNAQVSVSAITERPGTAKIQAHLRKNLLVIKAAYDASGSDLPKALHWFRTEQLSPFGQRTAEKAVADGRAYDVIRLIDSLHAGAAG
ncbi:MAG: hypothetical protein ABI893_00245 [Polaromonas sp.]|uniref:hypothetical protein n=1 Tax=Polaromonas sp. TaxID=1869339 RepID=UPI00326624EB